MNPKEKELIKNVALGKVNVVKEMLSISMNSNLKDEAGKSLLHIAVLNNRPKVVSVLLEKGAKVDIRNKSKETPLLLFLDQSRSKEDTIPLSLIAAGANVKLKKTPKSWSSLHWAVYKNWPKLVKKILENGGDVNENVNSSKNTPLHMTSSTTIGKILLDFGADVHSVNKEGLSPLESALALMSSTEELETSKSEIIKLCEVLIESGANCNKIDSRGLSVLMNAISRKLIDVSFLLIKTGANLNYSHDKIGAVIHFSSTVDNPQLLNEILNAGVDPNLIKKSDGYTPLHFAVANNCRQNVKLLMSRGADPTIKNNFSQNPVDFAIDMNDQEMLRLLNEYEH